MFGYIKPAYGELRMREHEMYRGAYCGLCRSMGRCTGCTSRLSLSYDLVFLALVRYALSGETPVITEGRCALHPFKKRPFLAHSETLGFTAGASAILTLGKIRDDITDEGGLRSFAGRLALPFASSAAKRADLGELDAAVLAQHAQHVHPVVRVDACDDLPPALLIGELDLHPGSLRRASWKCGWGRMPDSALTGDAVPCIRLGLWCGLPQAPIRSRQAASDAMRGGTDRSEGRRTPPAQDWVTAPHQHGRRFRGSRNHLTSCHYQCSG